MFTLIAYRSDGSDSCRSCYMGGWSSRCEVALNLNEQELVTKLVELKLDKYYHERDDGFEFSILADFQGRIVQLHAEGELYSSTGFLSGMSEEEIDEFEYGTGATLQGKLNELLQLANEQFEAAKNQLRLQKQIEANQKVQKEKERIRAQELAKIQELKAKYEVS